MEVKIYQNEICPFNIALLDNDKYTFFVLVRIIGGVCRLTVTDHKNFIISHSAYPYPVWVWLSENAGQDEYAKVYNLLKEHFFDNNYYKINTSYAYSEYITKRCKSDGIELIRTMNLLCYTCSDPIAPRNNAEGFAEVATVSNVDEIVSMLNEFTVSVNEKRTEEENREKAMEMIAEKRLFLWIDKKPVAMCGYNPLNETASINMVYTKPDARRKGYASALVHFLSEKLRAKGCLPLLYTDGDYQASNDCYKKIGFSLKGKLCTIDKKGVV